MTLITLSIGSAVPLIGAVFGLGALFARVAGLEKRVELIQGELVRLGNTIELLLDLVKRGHDVRR